MKLGCCAKYTRGEPMLDTKALQNLEEEAVGPLQPHNVPAAENFVENLQIDNVADGHMDENQLLEDPVVPKQNNNLAIVPYQPPLQPPLFVGAARIIFGPVLPPAMIWQRSFESLMPFF